MKHKCKVLSKWRRPFMALFVASVSALSLFAQGIAVSGTVIDETGATVPGANIVLKGTTSGTVTDANGAFSITVPDKDAVLEFSFVGYTTKDVTVGDQTTLSVTLRDDATQLEEVVVVGYGTTKKANLTGAVAQVSGERLENRSVPSITQALQGTVANLNISSANGIPGKAQNINIRGYTGLGTAGAPLVVIDGVQSSNDALSTLNMNDVETVSVLKDAASAAIYGSSAPFGVIIVNTKKGKTGQKPAITYNNNFGFSQPINLPHYVNSLDFAQAWNEVGVASNMGIQFSDDVIQRIKDFQAGTLREETQAKPDNSGWLEWNTSNANNDWYDVFFKNAAFRQQHNIGVSGGTERSSYYVGLGYNQQDGVFNWANDNYKRYNVRANLTSKLTDWLSFSLRSAWSRAETNLPYLNSSTFGSTDFSWGFFHNLGRKWPTCPLKYPDGTYSDASDVLFLTEGGRNLSTNDNAIVTGEFVVRPLAGWNITGNYTFDGTYSQASAHNKTFNLSYPDGTSRPKGQTVPNSFERSMGKNQHHTVNLFTSYEKQLNKHYFKLLLGYTQEMFDYFKQSGKLTNLYSDEVPSISLGYGTQSTGEDRYQLAVRGGFGRINYNYDEKYLVEFNGRYDGTSRFLSDVRFKFYPGVSAAWVVSREQFWEPLGKAVSNFKLRASWASLGNQDFMPSDASTAEKYYPFYPSLGNNGPTDSNWLFSGGRQANVSQPALVSNSLTWISTNTLDFGTDIAFLNNRLSVTFDWYRRSAKNYVGPSQSLPAILGTPAPKTNNAAMETTGFDLSIGWRDHIGEFIYGINAVLSDYRGKVTAYNNPSKLISDWYVGKSIGEIWGYQTVGLFKDQSEIDATDQSYLSGNWNVGDVHYANLDTDPALNIGDNTLDKPGDRKVIGNTTPRFAFGLNLNAEWKGFDFTLFLQGVGKRNYMFDKNSNYFWGFAGDIWQSAYFTVHTDRWTERNTNGYYPRAYFGSGQYERNRQPQTRYLQNAAYMRIKNIQIGYSLPKSVTDKIRFNKVRIFANVENLATFTKMLSIIDPELTTSDAKVYPLERTWAFGINVTF